MMKKYFFIVLISLILSPSYADKIVFVQGYLGEPIDWQKSGIISHLENNKWRSGGVYYYSNGFGLNTSKAEQANNQYFTVALPTESALQHQAFYLTTYLKHLRKHQPNDRLILVAHSAGGVLSRLVMVQQPELNISMLITIASPHLGSDLAELASIVGDTPLSLMTPFMGAATLNRSQALYSDLLPEQPGRFLFELNRQPHPQAEYVSIIRNPNTIDGGDLVVPSFSQDMRHVFALKNTAQSYVVNGGHSLNSRDGQLILDIITQYSLRYL